MKKLSFFAILLFVTQAVFAVNVDFLKDSVLTEFSTEERESFRSFVGDQLNTLLDQDVAEWQSESSNLAGKLKSRFTFNMNGVSCRRTVFLLTNRTNKEQYQFDMCNVDGSWRFAPTPLDSFRNSDWDMLLATVTEGLEIENNSQPISWFNSRSKNSGVIVPLELEQRNNEICRNLAISISDNDGLSSNGVFLFCKTPDSDWERKIEEE